MNLTRPGFLRNASLGAAGGALVGAAPAPAVAPIPRDAGRTGRLLIKNGFVVTLDRTTGEGTRQDVLVERGRIVEIGPHLAAADAAVIDATNTVVMPGFIDTHRHTWEGLLRNDFPDLSYSDYFKYVFYGIGPAYRPEDVYAGTLVSMLGAIDAGITTLLDFAHIQNSPAHTDASIHALRDSGMRAVFGYGYPTNGATHWYLDKRQSRYPEDLARIMPQYFNSNDQLVTLCLAVEGPGSVPDDVTLMQWKAARDAGIRISVHAGSATKRGFYEPFANVPGFFGSDTTYIHCCAFSETEWKLIADSGGTVSISPGSEMPMGHGMTAIQPALDHGIRPSLSVDVETTEPGDFFTTIRLTLYLQRQLINIRKLKGETDLPKWLTARDVLQLATIEGARACGLEHRTGTLTVGKEADIILLRTDRINVIPLNDPIGAVAEGMDTSNVDTVIVKGRLLKRHGQLLGVDVPQIAALVNASRDAVIAKAATLSPPHG
jgi:cytosine/adenosine deaminase-related metal-dependent hydrolase